VQVCPNGKLKWKHLQYAQEDIGNSTQDRKVICNPVDFVSSNFQSAQYSPAIAALTVATGAAIYYMSSFDDVLAVARPFSQKKRRFPCHL